MVEEAGKPRPSGRGAVTRQVAYDANSHLVQPTTPDAHGGRTVRRLKRSSGSLKSGAKAEAHD